MQPRDKTLTPALCISLIAHGLGLSGLAWWLVWTTPPPKYPAPDRLLVLLNHMPALSPPDALHPPPERSQPPKPKPPEAKPPEKFEKPKADLRDDSGEANGKGTANRSTDGEQPMLASGGPLEQADLMKQADEFDPQAILPASKGETTGNNAPPQTAPRQGITQQNRQPMDPSTAVVSAVDGVGPLPTAVKPPQSSASQNQSAAPKPVPRRVLGHKATLSDTESVAFARADHRVFEAGKLDGRKGLRTKTTIPKWGDAAQAYLRMMGQLHVVLGVTVDADGNVVNVVIIESSGNEFVDQDLKNEVWNSWNLEPGKDASGKIMDPHWTIVCQ